MKILFHIPRSMQQRCFRATDLARLAEHHELLLSRSDEPAELAAAWDRHAPTAQAIVTGWQTPPISQAMLDSAAQLQVLMHAAGSIKALLPAGVWDRPIVVATANAALAAGVAETTLGMIIAGLKGLVPCGRLTAAGGWKQGDVQVPGVPVRELFDVTIGVVGAGAIGRYLLKLLQIFEVERLVCDPQLDEAQARAWGARAVDLDTLLGRSDVVSLHAPALPQTTRMMGAQQFARMKDQAIFINTARGMLVDEAALVAELRHGRIWAFIDVTDPEPPAVDHPLRTLPNVVLTPHIAGALNNGCARLGRSSVDQLLAFGRGEPVSGQVTAGMLSAIA